MKKLISTLLIFILITALYACENTDTSTASAFTAQETISVDITNDEELQINETYKLGIAWEELLDKKGEKISQKDVAKLIKNADDTFYGKEDSGYLSWYLSNAKDKLATRMDLAKIIYSRKMEKNLNIKFTDINDFNNQIETLVNRISPIHLPNAGLTRKKADGSIGNFDLWTDCPDINQIKQGSNVHTVDYVIREYNRITADKLMKINDDNSFRPKDAVIIKDAIIAAYNYYYSIEPDATYVDVNNIGTYNKSIIADELISQQTSLPDATNSKLPSWKGFNFQYMADISWGALTNTENLWVTEGEIRALAESGANFLRLWTSFTSFEGPAYGNKNMVNMYYLEHLDQIIAWCIKYGLHVNISLVNGPGMDNTYSMDEAHEKTATIFTDTAYRNQFLNWYKMLARRYAAVPNKYLSYNLMNECDPSDDKNYLETFGPIVKAIWEQSPNRVIVADVHGQNITGESMAALGVALSYHLYNPREFCVVKKVEDPAYYESMTWPIPQMTSILYSKECTKEMGVPVELGGAPNVIEGDISGTLSIMISDLSLGSAVMRIVADETVIYEEIPEFVCNGDPSVDLCYTEKPIEIKIPAGTKKLEISCTEKVFALSSVSILCDDGKNVYFNVVGDNWQGTAPSKVLVNSDGSYQSSQTIDARAAMNMKHGLVSLNECKAIADKHKVGFMVGEFGIFEDSGDGNYLSYRIPRKEVYSMFTDLITRFDEMDIPWVANWVENYSVVLGYPLNKDEAYEKISGSGLYKNLDMLKFFQEIIDKK